MKLYRIAKWEEVFERAESRKLKMLTWVSMPVSFNSNGYQAMLDEFKSEAAAMYGAWCALVAFSASCHVRGLLGTSRGIPLTISHIARVTGLDANLFERLIEWASRDDIGWLIDESETKNETHHELKEKEHEKHVEIDKSGESPDDSPMIPQDVGGIPRLPDLTRPNITIPPPQTPPAVAAEIESLFRRIGLATAKRAARQFQDRPIEEIRQAVVDYQANRGKLTSPNSVVYFLENGAWPVDGVRPANEANRATSDRKARQLAKLRESVRCDVASDWKRTGRWSSASENEIEAEIERRLKHERRAQNAR